MNLSNIFEFCIRFASEELFGLMVASFVLALCGFIGSIVARHRSAATRFWIWQMVGSGVLLAFLLLVATLGIPLGFAGPTESSSNTVAMVGNSNIREFSEEELATAPGIKTQPMEHAPDPALGGNLITQIERETLSNPPNGLQSAIAEVGRTGKGIDPAENNDSSAIGSQIAFVLVLVWSSVFFGHLIWFAGCIGYCYRLASKATLIDAPHASTALMSARLRLNGSDSNESWNSNSMNLGLYASDRNLAPFAIGLFAPKIILPLSWATWSTPKLEMVIAHELAHIARHDVLWHWLNRLACCLAWFNPLIWMATKRAVFERERACDDRVIQSGIVPADYGQSLVEIAAFMSKRSLLTGGVSMAEPPLKQRLYWILSPKPEREKSSLGFCITAAILFGCITCALGLVRPLAVARAVDISERLAIETSGPSISSEMFDEQQESASPEKAKQEIVTGNSGSLSPPQIITFKMTDSVYGLVQTHDGQAVVGATVELRLIRHDNQQRQTVEVQELGSWETTTDTSGTYTIDTRGVGEIPEDTLLCIDRIYHPAIVEDGSMRWRAKDVSQRGKVGAITLKQCRKISGQVLDAKQQPTQAIIRAAGGVANPNLTWFPKGIQTDQNGQFKLMAPVDYQIELLVIAPGHVPYRVSVPGNETAPPPQTFRSSISIEELNGLAEAQTSQNLHGNNDPFDAGQIILQPGVTVTGSLLDGNNQPVEGVAVALETAYDTQLVGIAFFAHFACVTDPEGRFEFPPATGSCALYITDSAYASDRLDENLIKGKQPPRVNPIKFELDGKSQTKDIVLRELTATQKVSGTIKWDNGKPAAGVEVIGGASPDLKFGSVLTDEHGNYEIEFPRPLTDCYVRVWGAKDEGGVWHRAVAIREGKVSNGHFDLLDGDRTGVDWELRYVRSLPFDTIEDTKAKREFEAVEQMRAEFYKKLLEAEKASATPDEEEKAYMELDPRNALAKHYLAFEEKHRGKRVAFLAINAAMSSAASVGNPETEAAKGRNEMVDRLIKHYLDHEELATTFDNLDAGPPVRQRDRLLVLAIKRSPHRKVRGQAFLYRAEYAMKDLREAEMLPFYRDYVKRMYDNASPQYLEGINRRLDELAAIDQDSLRAEALTWLDVVATEYADIRVDTTGSHYDQLLGMVCLRFRFALTNIIVGKPAPEIKTTDINGSPIVLSQLRGRPVMLTICFDHVSDELDGQSFAKKHGDKDVEFVTIVGVRDLEEFNKKYPRESLAGAVATEAVFEGQIRSNWCINSKTTFVIDEQGILRSHGFSEEAAEKWLHERFK